jgi:hypothetical protein
MPRASGHDSYGALVTGSSWFALAWSVGVVLAIGGLLRRQRRESPTRDWVRNQPVLFEARAAIQIHARGTQGYGWASIHGAGWPKLVVHAGGLQATIGRFDGLLSGNTMLTAGSTMRRERLPAMPIVAGRRDCIYLSGNDGTGPREWRVAPRSTSVDELWAHLLAAGVSPA